MAEFLIENLLLIAFLFPAYLIMEWIEKHSSSKTQDMLGNANQYGPLIGSAVGLIPQCGFSSAAASLYSGGVISIGTLIAVFLSTSDELIPVLISKQIPPLFIGKLIGLKLMFGICVGFAVNAFLTCTKQKIVVPHVAELCEHSNCHCHEDNRGILKPAIVHTLQTFGFIFLFSAIVKLILEMFGGEEFLSGSTCIFNIPVVGEFLGGLVGLIPNCAASVACAELYSQGCMSCGSLLASSLTGAGLGLLVLFKVNRSFLDSLKILGLLYVVGSILGFCGGIFLK